MAVSQTVKVAPTAETDDLDGNRPDDPLLDCLSIITRLHGRPQTNEALAAGLPVSDHGFTPSLFVRAAEQHDFSARVLKRPLSRISSLVLPAVLLLKDGRACVLTRHMPKKRKREAEVIFPESGMGARTLPLRELAPLYNGYCIFIQPVPRLDNRMQDAESRPSRSWFWGTLWRFRRYYAEALVAAMLVNFLTLATALFTRSVYDRVLPNNAVDTLVVLATGTVIAIGLEFLARTLRTYFLDMTGKKADVLLAGTLLQQALGLRMEERPGSAGAFAAELREFESLRDFFASATLVTLTDLPFVILFIWVISLLAGPLYQVPMLAVPVVVLVGLVAQVPLSYLMYKHMRESVLRHGVLVESVEGLETLKTLSAEGIMQAKWENYTALTARTSVQSRTVSALVVNFAVLVQQCVTVGILVWGVYLVGEGHISSGSLIAAMILSGRALAPLGQVASLMVRYQQARVAYFSLDRLMKKPVERPRGRTFLHRPVIHGEIAFQGVGFAYPNQKNLALHDVSFRIGAGEHVGVLGRVGSGKSTLLKLMLGLYAPQNGSILVDGSDVQQFDPADLRRSTGYVSQDVRLFYGTLRQNVVLGAPYADDEAILAAARLSGLDRLVSQHPLGFDLEIGEGGAGLSGGQKQAVAIARAVLLAPSILLLDEPSNAMDHTTEQAFIASMAEFCKGRTLVVVTHKPSLLALVDRLLVLDGGRIIADGPRDAVLRALTRPLQGVQASGQGVSDVG